MTHDRESGLLNYQSYIRCLSHENQEIYSSMGVAGIHIWDLRDIISAMAMQEATGFSTAGREDTGNF